MIRTQFQFRQWLRAPLVLVLFFFLVPGAEAQGKLKKLVFEDCTEAKQALPSLDQNEQSGFYEYLIRVLKMRTVVSSELLGDIPVAALRTGPGTDISRIFNPTREIDAKFCALDLLLQESPKSVPALPELISVIAEQGNSLDLVERVEAAVWELTEAVQQNPGPGLDLRWIGQLTAQLSNPRFGYLAANVLMELHRQSLSRVLESLSSPDAKQVAAVQSLLLRLDRAGVPVGPALLRLLESSDDELRMRAAQILALLPGFRAQSIPALLKRLGDPSPIVSQGVFDAIEKLIANPDARLQNFTISDDSLAAILLALQTTPPNNRAVIEKLLVEVQLPEGRLAEQLLELTRSADPDLRERAIRLIALKTPSGEPLPPAVFEALYDPAYTVQLAALKSMSLSDFQADEKLSALLKVLKGNATQKDSGLRDEFLLGAAKLVVKLPATSSALRTVPYFIEGLSIRNRRQRTESADFDLRAYSENEIVQALVHLGKASLAPVTKELKESSRLSGRERSPFLVKFVQSSALLESSFSQR